MSGSPDDERIEELRRKKMQELQQQAESQQQSAEQQQAEEAAQQRAEQQKQALLKKFLTDEARQRLNAVQMSKPDFADKVERQIVALAQSGRIQGRIDDAKMKALLKELQPESKSFNIRRR